ncbi:sigma-70 family RNA polymerase sigma factor [Kribbella endophytica]
MVQQCNADSSWDEVVRTHTVRVYRYAYRLTQNRHDAEDLMQDVFVRVFQNLSRYRAGSFEGWLYRITRNLFLDRLRRRRVHLVPIPSDLQLVDGLTPDQDFDARTFDPDVRAALGDLPSCYLATLILHDVDGLKYDEIAVILNIQPGTVASRLHRARSRLRIALVHRSPAQRELSA